MNKIIIITLVMIPLTFFMGVLYTSQEEELLSGGTVAALTALSGRIVGTTGGRIFGGIGVRTAQHLGARTFARVIPRLLPRIKARAAPRIGIRLVVWLFQIPLIQQLVSRAVIYIMVFVSDILVKIHLMPKGRIPAPWDDIKDVARGFFKPMGASGKLIRIPAKIQLIFSGMVLCLVSVLLFKHEGIPTPLFAFLSFIVALIVILVHNLSQTLIARRYNKKLEFEPWVLGLGLVIGVAILLQDVFASVMGIKTKDIEKDKLVGIALAGPYANLLVFSVTTAVLYFIPVGETMRIMMHILAVLNVAYALDNLFPMEPVDGYHIFRYSKKLWAFITLPLWIIGFGMIV
ncbi:MAG: hypothetical protein MSIBF_01470 [Candidatus Altiarchaeales archaeon IMC4]|nr:MAG: hypothetical protein MSIBF_01470 [Candidatus Altiarchaeales archaeon IMC4]